MKSSFFSILLLSIFLTLILAKFHVPMASKKRKIQHNEPKFKEENIPVSKFSSTPKLFQRSTLYYEDLTSVKEQFTGKIKFGGSNQEFAMVFDTTSKYTWVVGDQCLGNCLIDQPNHPKFKCQASCQYIPNYELQAITAQETNGIVSNHNSKITAYEARDSVYLDKLTLKNAKIFVAKQIDDSKNLQGQGIIGLANHEDNLIMQYKNQGKILNAKFSFHISDSHNIFNFGLQQDFFGLEDYTAFPTIRANQPLWSIQLYKVYFNSAEDTNLLSTKKEVNFDSSIDGIGVPSAVLTKIREKFKAQISTCTDTNKFTCGCSKKQDLSKLPVLSLSFGNNKRVFELKGPDYGKFVEEKNAAGIITNTYCDIHIFEGSSLERWVLGIPFLRAHYTVFDQENQEIKVATKYKEPLQSFVHEDESRLTVIIGGIIFAVLAIIILFFVLKPVPLHTAIKDYNKEY